MKRVSGWIPPKSPAGLLQERYWPDEWKILVCCILLNRTKRAQVEPILDQLFQAYPDARVMSRAEFSHLSSVLKPLGFQNRRARTLQQFSDDFLNKLWDDPRELYGVGEYAARGWEMLCAGIVGDEPPQDHALTYYWEFLTGMIARSLT